MSLLMRCYRRLRHLKGYGVHSPSAYTLVREVVHPPRGYAYYCYTDLPRSFSINIGKSGVHGKVSLNPRLVMRLALWCRPKLVSIVGAPTAIVPFIESGIKSGCPDAVCDCVGYKAREADMIIDLSGAPLQVSSSARVVLCQRSRQAIARLSEFKTGVLMQGRRNLLYFATPAPFHILDMWL